MTWRAISARPCWAVGAVTPESASAALGSALGAVAGVAAGTAERARKLKALAPGGEEEDGRAVVEGGQGHGRGDGGGEGEGGDENEGEADGDEDEEEAGLGRHCPPRHPPHIRPSRLQFINSIT